MRGHWLVSRTVSSRAPWRESSTVENAMAVRGTAWRRSLERVGSELSTLFRKRTIAYRHPRYGTSGPPRPPVRLQKGAAQVPAQQRQDDSRELPRLSERRKLPRGRREALSPDPIPFPSAERRVRPGEALRHGGSPDARGERRLGRRRRGLLESGRPEPHRSADMGSHAA